MLADKISRRATLTILNAAALAVFCSATMAAAADPVQPETQATPAYMFLELPSNPAHTGSECGVLSFTYDAESGVPLHRRGDAVTPDGEIKATLVLVKSDVALPVVAKTPYAWLEVLETDADRKTLRRLTFHDVRVSTVGPAGDDPAERVTFTAKSVSIH